MTALLIHPSDNTVTLLDPVREGEKVVFLRGGEQASVTALSDVPFGHKVAIRAIAEGEPVIKYGETIGSASRAIREGEYVHTQNLDSNRARGDLADAPASLRATASARGKAGGCAKEGKFSSRTFLGYPRKDGLVGTRNYVAVVSCVVCANDVVSKLAAEEGIAAFTHQQGCSQTKPDVEQVKRVLINIVKNPNVGAVVYVSLGCESVPTDQVAEEAAKTGKPVALLCIQEIGGASETTRRCQEVARQFRERIKAEPVECPVSRIRLGLKCGSSDTTQGLSANVIAGKITEAVVNAGGSVIIGETTEFMGAEHIAASRAVNPEVGAEIVRRVGNMEARAKAVGVDMRGGQPTRGNIAGGLTTIEEKSLGALAKAGDALFQEVVDYGTVPQRQGLVMMDSPGREPEMLTGLASAGCNVILFTTGRGAPQGFPFVPVVKVTGNARTWKVMGEHMDACVADVMEGKLSIERAADNLMEEILGFCGGKPTKAEQNAYNNSMNIYVTGPVI